MLNIINKTLASLFGNKSERDVKKLLPIVAAINEHFESYRELSNDDLREVTNDLKRRIQGHLSDLNNEMSEIRETLENSASMDISEKEELYQRLDKLQKEHDAETEKILEDILPEAFAVVKETARRFSENTEIKATATDFDREVAVKKQHVIIEGNQVVYKTTWLAAGVEVTWNMVHYDVQLIGGSVLHSGKIAEMATGEGKTLVATLPTFLNALAGKGVHIVTVNDYLARRDCEWMGPLYEFHGLSVDCIDYHQPNSPERRKAYQADITFGTNNEFGFDYLRDNMATSTEDLVQRKHHFAMVDEVDSVLIDDARTPLIISGPISKGSDEQQFYQLKPRIERLVETQKKYINTVIADARKFLTEKKEKEAGLALLRAHRGLPRNKTLIKLLSEPGVRALLTKTENFYLQDQSKEMPKVDAELYFVIEEKNNQIELTEKGIELITASGEDPHFFVIPDVGSEIAEIERSAADEKERKSKKEELMRDFSIKSERIHTINQLLKAYSLFERDVEYIIADGKIKIVDEQTGRVLDGRRYSDGLHQAIEAKENVKVEAATQTFATVTLQNYFRMYHKLAGMTGTAETEAGEFWEIYKLDVVVIPTNRDISRKDLDDLVYKTKREKYNAVIDQIAQLQQAGRPVLVGTTSVEVSELLSRMLKLRNIRHNVLNAKQHQREAEIVAEAGLAGTVTIATNMAGRGTDIKLGPGVKESGGLAIIGTERHESRRVDRQLRGRAGRQGDPGTSQFYVSLEDDLMRLFGSERISRIMDRLGHKEGDVIQHSMISNSIERAQKKVEQNNFGIRKRLLEYDDVMNNQREVIYGKRRNALFGERLAVDINNMIYDLSQELVNNYQGNFEEFKLETLRLLAIDPDMSEEDFNKGKTEAVTQSLFEALYEYYKQRSEEIAAQAYPVITDIYTNQGQQFENVAVPFSDGIKGLNIVANLKRSYETKGHELVRQFEKIVSLILIDEAWKEHLREMDELKQSVQNAVLEQKDPLLIYKLESFKLFDTLLSNINRDVLAMLYKGHIAVQGSDEVKQAQAPRKVDMSKMQTRRTDNVSSTGPQPRYSQPQAPVMEDPLGDVAPKPAPVRVGDKVGRNDPCPCGSGKKFKQCHGKDLVN